MSDRTLTDMGGQKVELVAGRFWTPKKISGGHQMRLEDLLSDRRETSMVDPELKELLTGVKRDVADKLRDHGNQLKDHDEKINAILRMPAGQVILPDPPQIFNIGRPKLFLGFDLNRQGLKFKSGNDEKREKAAKWLLAFIKAFSMGGHADSEALEYLHDHGVQKAAMAEGTGSTGGYLTPDELTDEILAFGRERSVALELCRQIPMSSDVRKVPAELTNVTVAWTAEGVAATESEPTLSEITLTAKRLDAFSIVSNELLQDAVADVASWLTGQFGEALGLELDNQLLNGTGTPCSGVLSAACGYSVVMATGSTSFSKVDPSVLSDMIAKLRPSVLANSTFILHRVVLNSLRQQKDSQGRYIWGNPSEPDPQSIWGYKYRLCEKSPSVSATSTPFIALGDFRYFCLGRRLQNFALDSDPFSKFKEYQTQFRIVNRWALAIGLANAFCRLLTSAS